MTQQTVTLYRSEHATDPRCVAYVTTDQSGRWLNIRREVLPPVPPPTLVAVVDPTTGRITPRIRGYRPPRPASTGMPRGALIALLVLVYLIAIGGVALCLLAVNAGAGLLAVIPTIVAVIAAYGGQQIITALKKHPRGA